MTQSFSPFLFLLFLLFLFLFSFTSLLNMPSSGRPTHIAIPPTQVFFSSFNITPTSSSSSSSSSPDDPFDSILFDSTPSEQPTTPPNDLPVALQFYLPTNTQSALPEPPPEDSFPAISQTFDIALDDTALSTLEKIYLFSTSDSIVHRIFILTTLHTSLHQVSPRDALDYVLPLISALAMDDGSSLHAPFLNLLICPLDDAVKETLAAQLVNVIWWFFTVSSTVFPPFH
jgi:serine/threonine-protein phosphatase 4 regulatory subunit 1